METKKPYQLYEEEFKKLGAEVYISTVDGSYGVKGFVTDIVKDLKDYTYYLLFSGHLLEYLPMKPTLLLC